MNKALHALVFVILAIAAGALCFEYKLYGKKELLRNRNQQLEDYLVKISNTIEVKKAGNADQATAPEAHKDVSPVEAKVVDTPETENLLDGYKPELEEKCDKTLSWGDAERKQLRQYYSVDGDGNRVADELGGYRTKGPGTAQELLDKLFEQAKVQRDALNSTRAALADMRKKLVAVTADYNKIKGASRQDKVDVETKKGEITELEQAKAAKDEETTKLKTQVDDLNTELKSKNDEISSAKDETEAVREDLDKEKKLTEQLKNMLKNAVTPRSSSGSTVASQSATLKAGVKGKIVEVNADLMFAVVKFEKDAMAELLGEDLQGALPQIDMGLRRKDLKGPAGEYVGRIRLRQAVAGKDFVIVDILGDWLQTPVQKGDEVFAE